MVPQCLSNLFCSVLFLPTGQFKHHFLCLFYRHRTTWPRRAAAALRPKHPLLVYQLAAAQRIKSSAQHSKDEAEWMQMPFKVASPLQVGGSGACSALCDGLIQRESCWKLLSTLQGRAGAAAKPGAGRAIPSTWADVWAGLNSGGILIYFSLQISAWLNFYFPFKTK